MDSAKKFNLSVPVELQEMNVIVYNLKKHITELSYLTEKIDATVKRDNTPCDIVDLPWLFEEKCKMLDNIKQQLNDLDLDSNILTTEGETFIALYDTLMKENKQHKLIFEHIAQELQFLEDNLTEKKEFLNTLAVNEEATETSKISTPEMLDVNLLQKKSAEKMREWKTRLHTLLNVCFKDTRTKDFIQDLTVAYFEGGDNKYIDISDLKTYSIFDINMVKYKTAGLVVEDPYDKMRIKIDDII